MGALGVAVSRLASLVVWSGALSLGTVTVEGDGGFVSLEGAGGRTSVEVPGPDPVVDVVVTAAEGSPSAGDVSSGEVAPWLCWSDEHDAAHSPTVTAARLSRSIAKPISGDMQHGARSIGDDALRKQLPAARVTAKRQFDTRVIPGPVPFPHAVPVADFEVS